MAVFGGTEDFQEDLDMTYNERLRLHTVNGREYKVRAHDPYGFWKIEASRKLPDSLKSQFTNIDSALQAIDAYEAANKSHLDKLTEKKLAKVKPNTEL